MRFALLFTALLIPLASSAKRPPAPKPSDEAARARLLVDAIRANDPALALPFFFDKDAFRKVKAIKAPDKYFDYLIRVYAKDIQSIREKLAAPDTVEFVSFKLGRGRNWIPRGKEANRLPYYATYKSRLVLKDDGRERTIKVRVMITWEGKWFVTHLSRKKLNEPFPDKLFR